MLTLAGLGYRCIAPDLRGFGDSNAPLNPGEYTLFHVVGDLIGLLDAMQIDKAFVVGHDWGAIVAWNLCLFRPDRVNALVNTSVAFQPRQPEMKPVEMTRAFFGDDFYVCRFQELGEVEEMFAQTGMKQLIKLFLTNRETQPPTFPKEIGPLILPDDPIPLPSWLIGEDVNYFANKFQKTGFTGPLNYYRALDLNWELTAPWQGCQVKVPVKFIIGDQDVTYHLPGAKEYVKFIIGDQDVTYHLPGAKEYINGEDFKQDVPFLEQVVVLEGVTHFLTQEKPDIVSRHIYDFIRKFLAPYSSKL